MILLASASTVRSQLLRQAGVEFRAINSGVDESEVKKLYRDLQPHDLAAQLAGAKACAVSSLHPEALVIGADQLLVAGGVVYDKPVSMEAAAEQLRQFRNSTHQLVAAVCTARNGKLLWQHIEKAQLVVRDFSDLFLESYLNAGGPELLTSVGAYKLEAAGLQLFSAIEGDYFTILGLPMLPLLAHLRDLKCLPS